MEEGFDLAPFLWIEDGQEEAYTPRTRRRNNKKKKEFVGWGSRQLIEFLESVGRETSKVISQHDITEIINQYVNDNRLINPIKKKRVMCDERLLALFGRKSINRVKIYDLLEAHLAEHQVDSDDDLFGSSDEKEEEEFVRKRQRVVISDKKIQYKKKVPDVSKMRLAAISPENIKLVYLKRSLVEELLKCPDTFETKVVGSFVRIKSDPLDIFQKNSHQLELVKGIKTAAADGNSCTHVQISGMMHEIRISALSDDNFSEEECEDLHKRIKDGLIEQPTVGELEQRVAILHEDITRHWITRELALLKNLIDRANEKGWRPRVTECLDKRRLLQTPSEQSRLMSEIPKVKAETVSEDPPEEENLNDDDSQNLNNDDSPKAMDWDWEPIYEFPAKAIMATVSANSAGEAEVEIRTRTNNYAHSSSPKEETVLEEDATRAETNGHAYSIELNERDLPNMEAKEPESNGHSKFHETKETREKSNGQLQLQLSEAQELCGLNKGNTLSKQVEVCSLNTGNMQSKPVEVCGLNMGNMQSKQVEVYGLNKGNMQSKLVEICDLNVRNPQSKPVEVCGVNKGNTQSKQVEVIDLSDDDDELEVPHAQEPLPVPDPFAEQLVWHYFDPQGIIRGPFSLASLKRWRDANFFPRNFRVWKSGRGPHEALLLNDLLVQFFPN